MSKKNKKGRGAPSLLTLLIRVLIVLIFVAALVIAFNRLGEVMQNNQKKKALQEAQGKAAPAVERVLLPSHLLCNI